jgi:hypothetical protein
MQTTITKIKLKDDENDLRERKQREWGNKGM